MKKTLTAMSLLAVMSTAVAAQETKPASIQFVAEQTQAEVLATDFTGEAVVTKSGERVGDINNLVFDESGRIALGVIGVGGFMGMGEKEVAVPFDTLKPETRDGKQVLVLDVTKEQIQAAPAYKTLNDQRFNERVTGWKEKAKEGWTKVSEQAKTAYEQAKTTVQNQAEKMSEPSEQGAEPAKPAEPATPAQPATPPANSN